MICVHFRTYPEGSKFASVNDSMVNGTIIAIITARSNQSLIFKLAKGNEDGLFRLEPGHNFSILRLNKTSPLWDQNKESFLLTIAAFPQNDHLQSTDPIAAENLEVSMVSRASLKEE